MNATYTCCMPNSGATSLMLGSSLQLEIIPYPFLSGYSWKYQYVVEVGSDISFDCDAVHSTKVEFYVDGLLVAPGTLPNVELNASKKQITFKQVQLHHSISVMCVWSNEAGTVFESTNLIVHGEICHCGPCSHSVKHVGSNYAT